VKKNLKLHEDSDNFRLTWKWQEGEETVLVNERIYTLQEYKNRGGFFIKKTPGIFTYKVGEDEITFTVKIQISISIRKKKNFEINFSSEHDIPENIICYKINDIVYYFGEKIEAKKFLTRIVRADKNETINFFISEENSHLYDILQCN
jgi:hypothetical protein